jgi:hypothetical protein
VRAVWRCTHGGGSGRQGSPAESRQVESKRFHLGCMRKAAAWPRRRRHMGREGGWGKTHIRPSLNGRASGRMDMPYEQPRAALTCFQHRARRVRLVAKPRRSSQGAVGWGGRRRGSGLEPAYHHDQRQLCEGGVRPGSECAAHSYIRVGGGNSGSSSCQPSLPHDRQCTRACDGCTAHAR